MSIVYTYLHGNEFCPPVLFRAELHGGKLVCPHGRSSNVTDLPRSDEVMKSTHSLLNWRIWVETMNPEEIYVICLQTLEGRVQCSKNRCPRKTELVNVVLGPPQFIQDWVCVKLLLSNAAKCLRHQHQLVTWDIVFLDRLSDNSLRISIGIDICCIPLPRVNIIFTLNGEQKTNGVNSSVICRFQEWEGLFWPCHPVCPLRVSNAHTPNNWRRHPETTVSHTLILDLRLLQRLCNAFWKSCHG